MGELLLSWGAGGLLFKKYGSGIPEYLELHVALNFRMLRSKEDAEGQKTRKSYCREEGRLKFSEFC